MLFVFCFVRIIYKFRCFVRVTMRLWIHTRNFCPPTILNEFLWYLVFIISDIYKLYVKKCIHGEPAQTVQLQTFVHFLSKFVSLQTLKYFSKFSLLCSQSADFSCSFTFFSKELHDFYHILRITYLSHKVKDEFNSKSL